MNEFRLRGVPVFGAALLAACSSAPMRFHTLSDTTPAAGAVSSTQPALAFVLDPVSVPRQVDIPQLVLRNLDGTLRLAENQRWLAPLGEEIRTALSQSLQAQLNAADVSRAPAAEGTRVVRLKVDIQRFDTLPGDQVRVGAQWNLRDATSPSVLASCATQATEAAAQGADGLVEGYRRALQRIAGSIAVAIAQPARGASGVECPAAEITPAG